MKIKIYKKIRACQALLSRAVETRGTKPPDANGKPLPASA